jgi:hypothetical protein
MVSDAHLLVKEIDRGIIVFERLNKCGPGETVYIERVSSEHSDLVQERLVDLEVGDCVIATLSGDSVTCIN